jgi:maltooligosyltrehalose trehalohydrolase
MQNFRLGGRCTGPSTCSFQVWAPYADQVAVHLLGPHERIVPLARGKDGFFAAEVDYVSPGARYQYRLNNWGELPDPASRSQPDGVHGASEIVAEEFAWTDAGWRGIPLTGYVLYELHVGTFTPEGTFDGVVQRLDYLRDLGITAIEIMPVAQFPGERNWGYDGVFPFAVQHSYGGATHLKRLVDAAHSKGLAVVLDVVYNHLGPEGNYFGQFGPYFTDRHETPWGKAINFDGPDSKPVRRFFIENALQWVEEFHIDALRLDAVHSIFDESPQHILQELAAAVHHSVTNRAVHVIAESNLNDVRLIEPVSEGGYGLDAQWNDDFHHALHAFMTRESNGYLKDYGTIRHIARAYQDGFVYSGQFSEFRGHVYGTSSRHIPPERFLVCTQNHDQIGNRMLGERETQLLSWEQVKLSAGALLLSPYVPLLFMGQEYGETAPFLYFVSHSDAGLIEAVRSGRQHEFRAFAWQGTPPDPQDEATFYRSRLNHSLLDEERNRVLHSFYRTLLELRKTEPSLRALTRIGLEVSCLENQSVLLIQRQSDGRQSALILNFGDEEVSLDGLASGEWHKRVDSSESRWLGPGSRTPAAITLQDGDDARVAVAPSSICLLVRGA